MTSEKKEAPKTSPPGRPKSSARRRRARSARRIRRVATVAILAVLALGLIGMGLWLLFEKKPEVTVQVYPVEYEAQIRARAAENGLDPALVAAVILAESSYQPDAVSEANAQGLMQLLPSTAEWIAPKFDEQYAEGALFDPELNIKYGCWYLGYLMRRYDGDMTCASSAYHQGPGTVDKWLADEAWSADGRTLTDIPSEATETYVKRVLDYYERYAEIYAA